MLAEYQVRVYSPNDGTLVAVYDKWRRLEFRHIINKVDWCKLTINGRLDVSDVFLNNAPIEVWRRVPGYEPNAVPEERQRDGGWYVEWDGLHGDDVHTTYANGDQSFTSWSDGGLDLVNRREVLWLASTGASESKKVAIPAQTAIYQFVEENCGASALQADGRLIDGEISTLSIPVLIGAGDNWSGQRAFRNVLEVIEEIANTRAIDYDVISLGDGNWQFLTYVNQLGEDRTTVGLDTATGKNAAGNAPVIFSLEQHNVEQVTYKTIRRESATVVAALGKGQYAARTTGLYINSDEINVDRRINQREITRNATTQDDVTELETVAEEWGTRLQPTQDFSFVPLRGASNTIYGVNYWWADKVTGRYAPRNAELDKRIVGVTIMVDVNGENFREWDMETIPRT